MSHLALAEISQVIRGELRTTRSESEYRLRPSDVANGRPPERITSSTVHSVMARTGDIAVNLSYRPGTAMLITPEMDGVAPTDGVALVRIGNDPRIDRTYLTTWLLAGDVIRQLKPHIFGTHMIYVKVGALEKVEVPVPTLDVQRRLAEGSVNAQQWKELAVTMLNDATHLLELERRKFNALLGQLLGEELSGTEASQTQLNPRRRARPRPRR